MCFVIFFSLYFKNVIGIASEHLHLFSRIKLKKKNKSITESQLAEMHLWDVSIVCRECKGLLFSLSSTYF